MNAINEDIDRDSTRSIKNASIVDVDYSSAPFFLIGEKILYNRAESSITHLGPSSSGGELNERLTLKQQEFIELLIKNHPTPCPSAEIINEIWSGHSSPESVTQLVNKTRKTLCDKNKTILTNTPRRGYMLCSVTPVDNVNCITNKLDSKRTPTTLNGATITKINYIETLTTETKKIFSRSGNSKLASFIMATLLLASLFRLGAAIYPWLTFTPLDIPPYPAIENANGTVTVYLPNKFTCIIDRQKHEAICKK